MSLEQAIEKLTAAMIGNTAAVLGQVGTTKPAANDKAATPAAAKTEAKKEDPAPPAADGAVTYKAVGEVLVATMKKIGRPAIVAILKEHGLGKPKEPTEADPSTYTAALTEVNAKTPEEQAVLLPAILKSLLAAA